jgi:arylsulfatase A-like enzyme
MTDELQYSMRELIFDIYDAFSGISAQLEKLENPSLSYFHLFPPHAPYLPTDQFRKLFLDNWKPVSKPKHPLYSEFDVYTNKELNEERLKYDQFIATADDAFEIFLDSLEKSGLLDNSYVILTSDHGESFERGYWEHTGPLIYEPSVHIPLLISAPGQRNRRDFYTSTNSIDLLPTLMHIAELDVPEWCEGDVLPGYGLLLDKQRTTFSMDAKQGAAFGDLHPISVAMYQGNYKLIYYKGYGEENSPYRDGLFELYDFKEDPEEMNNLIEEEKIVARQMREYLLSSYRTANKFVR